MPIRHWTDELTSEESNEILTELALAHASRITCAAEREYLTASITSRDIRNLCDYNPSYAKLTVYDALNARQISAFFSKRRDLEFAGINKRRSAIEKFIEAELQCRLTNEVLRARADGLFFFKPSVESVLHRAQRKIASILGDLPPLSDIKLRFGPGATTQVKKKNASAKRKLSMPFSCSEDAIPMISQVLEELPKWVFNDDELSDPNTVVKQVPVEIHPGRLDFVRKTYKTDRSIVVEPMLNQMVQLGIGDYIADRLRMSGIDLKDQSRNKALAREGSISGDLATLDLSSASDTVSKNLVLDLLPYDWFEFLSTFRTGKILCEGVEIQQQKFSSMGNGFTFALESLIFYALSWAVCDQTTDFSKVSVYGDDIIIPTRHFAELVEVLKAVGFTPNLGKSFAEGPFRESCGGDYMRGINIRPCYCKGPLSGQSLFVLHNFYVRNGDLDLAELVRKHIPYHIQRYGPDGYGDGHLIGDRGLRPHGRKYGWSGYTFETYTLKPKKDFSVLPGDRVYPFYSIYQGSSPDLIDDEWSPLMSLNTKDIQYGRPGHSYDLRGNLGVPIPGAQMYKLIKIYTLSPAIA